MKVALVHDYLKEFGGAERVLEVLHEMWPEAPIFTAFVMREKWGPHRSRLEKWDIKTTWMQKLPWKDRLTSHYALLGPMAFESLDLKEYDVVINSTNPYVSKAVITHPNQLHIAYVHTPPKGPWGYEGASSARKKWWMKPLVAVGDAYLRMADWSAAQRPDVLVANSKEVAKRIKKFYQRESVVIYPPVEINTKERKNEKTKGRNYYLVVGRLVGGKDYEWPVRAALELDFELKIVGKGMGLGSVEGKLRELATGSEKVKFLGEVSDEELSRLYAGARAVIDSRPDEDFGIIPVEAMAAGVPVIARNSGGFRETVVDGKTGVLFGDYEGLLEAVGKLDKLDISKRECVKQANKFSRTNFEKKFGELVEREWQKKKSS